MNTLCSTLDIKKKTLPKKVEILEKRTKYEVMQPQGQTEQRQLSFW